MTFKLGGSLGVGVARSRLAAGCLYAGGFVLFVCLLFPLKQLAVPGPLYYVTELVVLMPVSALVGTVGCLLTANPRAIIGLFFGLIAAAALMVAGGGTFVGIAAYHPANLLGRGAMIALAMAAVGYILSSALGRRGKQSENVT